MQRTSFSRQLTAPVLRLLLFFLVLLFSQLELIFGTIGVAVIERVGLDLSSLISSSPVLSKYASNIDIVPQRISNTISSTTVRKLIQAQQSVRFLTPDPVIDYIQQHRLYGHDPAKHVPAEYLQPRD
jgi:nicotinamide mononucleotide adenylyltransferase